jgi:hypothetical protein
MTLMTTNSVENYFINKVVIFINLFMLENNSKKLIN